MEFPIAHLAMTSRPVGKQKSGEKPRNKLWNANLKKPNSFTKKPVKNNYGTTRRNR